MGRPGEQVILYVLKQGVKTGSDSAPRGIEQRLETFLITLTWGRGATGT